MTMTKRQEYVHSELSFFALFLKVFKKVIDIFIWIALKIKEGRRKRSEERRERVKKKIFILIAQSFVAWA